MGESSKHIQLVDCVYEFVCTRVSEDVTCLVNLDSPDSSCKPSNNRDGYKPDVLFYRKDYLIVGEAKTSLDLNTRHSLSQIESYIRECMDFNGSSLFVLGVPFGASEIAVGVISSITSKIGKSIHYVVLNEIGIYKEE